MKRFFRFACIFLMALYVPFLCPIASSGAFVPEQPTLSVDRLRAGMQGYMLTVLKGTKPIRLPLEIVSVVPQRGSLKNAVVIRMLPSSANKIGGVAQGMSGSPVYVDGKLIGALGMGWNFSDHRMALVTPIDEMCQIFSWPDKPVNLKGLNSQISKRTSPGFKLSDPALYSSAPSFFVSRALANRSLPLRVGGLSERAVSELRARLGVPMETAPYGAGGELPVEPGKLSPGDAVAVLLAWGDVEMAATGTVTATSRNGQFLAFGHAFLERGAVNFPIARATIHETVFSQMFPFKLASPTALAGTATQDRTAGVGGRMNYFTPSIAATLTFKDTDLEDRRSTKNFRIVPDAFLGSKLLEGIYGGLFEDLWGRKGQGTATVTLRVEGRGLERGWTRTNIFFSDSDTAGTALKEPSAIMEMFLLQPFKEVYPLGFRLDVAVTQEPKMLLIEDVVVSSDARPGETVGVEVTLRPWRRRPVKKFFEVTVPKEAAGVCELIVRGGGTNSLPQLAVNGGWKSIDSFDRMLTELDAADANNELVVELLYDPAGGKEAKNSEKKGIAELLPEEKEFLSETKTRRIKEGTLRIFRSEYVVEGLMKRLISLGNDD